MHPTEKTNVFDIELYILSATTDDFLFLYKYYIFIYMESLPFYSPFLHALSHMFAGESCQNRLGRVSSAHERHRCAAGHILDSSNHTPVCGQSHRLCSHEVSAHHICLIFINRCVACHRCSNPYASDSCQFAEIFPRTY